MNFKATLVPEVFREPRESRKAPRREKRLVTLDLNLTSMHTPGSGSDPQVRIGYFYERVNQFDWFVKNYGLSGH